MSNKHSIAALRAKAGLTQVELAEKIGVSENTIANWEKGTASKWIKQLHRLCTTLNCTLDDLDPQPSPEEKSSHLLMPDHIDKVKRRCIALAQNRSKVATQIASHATLYDPALRYWLEQADQVMEQWCDDFQNLFDCDINCEAVINTLILQNLLNQLSVVQPDQIEYVRFCELVQQTELTSEFLNQYITFNENHFTRQLILQTPSLTVYLIGWRPSQIVEMHHHGNSLDAILVLEGEMTHWLMSVEECEQRKIPYEGCSNAQKYDGNYNTVKAGDYAFIDRRHAHQIQNLSDQNLVTLHFRFGAPPDDTNWSLSSKHCQHLLKWEHRDECIVVAP